MFCSSSDCKILDPRFTKNPPCYWFVNQGLSSASVSFCANILPQHLVGCHGMPGQVRPYKSLGLRNEHCCQRRRCCCCCAKTASCWLVGSSTMQGGRCITGGAGGTNCWISSSCNCHNTLTLACRQLRPPQYCNMGYFYQSLSMLSSRRRLLYCNYYCHCVTS